MLVRHVFPRKRKPQFVTYNPGPFSLALQFLKRKKPWFVVDPFTDFDFELKKVESSKLKEWKINQ